MDGEAPGAQEASRNHGEEQSGGAALRSDWPNRFLGRTGLRRRLFPVPLESIKQEGS